MGQARLWCKPKGFVVEAATLGKMFKRHVMGPLKKLGREVDRMLAWRWLMIDPDRIVDKYTVKFRSEKYSPSGV